MKRGALLFVIFVCIVGISLLADGGWGVPSAQAEGTIPPPPPTNDFFADAIAITPDDFDFTQTVYTNLATLESGEPNPSCLWDWLDRTVWYRFQTPQDMLVTAYAQSEWDFDDGVLAVYEGESITQLIELACGTFYPWDESRATFTAIAGKTYYIQIGGQYGDSGTVTFRLKPAPNPIANFGYWPDDPSIYDWVYFSDYSWDPAGVGIASQAWDFGDGDTATGCCPSHKYGADGDYTAHLEVTTSDGRIGAVFQSPLVVHTRDVAITKFSAPSAASPGQTRKLSVGVNSKRYEEQVEVYLFKSVPGGFQEVGRLVQTVPVRPANRTTDFAFSYTFTAEDGNVGKVTFKAEAYIINGRDALPADNTAIADPTKLGNVKKAQSDDEPADSLFMPLVTGS